MIHALLQTVVATGTAAGIIGLFNGWHTRAWYWAMVTLLCVLAVGEFLGSGHYGFAAAMALVGLGCASFLAATINSQRTGEPSPFDDPDRPNGWPR